MSEINRGLDHMANLQRGWSPGQAMLPPDPGGLNRALDRAAAEHLREVAPHLAPSAPAPPQPEPRTCHCGAYTASECECRKRAPNAPPQLERDELGRLCVNGQPHRPADPRMLGAPFCVVCYHPLAPAPPAEAKGEQHCQWGVCALPHTELTREEFETAIHRMAVSAHGITKVLAHDAALRTRAREESERAEKWRSELSAACELSERYRSIVTEALNQPPAYWYDKHDNGEWSAEHAAFAIAALFRERDEAREQREDLANEILAGRSDLAAANARAEEAESERVTANEAASDADRVAATERAARVAAEAERDAFRAIGPARGITKPVDAVTPRDLDEKIEAWEQAFHEEICRGDEEAVLLRHEFGITPDGRSLVDQLLALAPRLAAAEAEVKRRDEYPHPCLICFGTRPHSGKPCACGGTNNVYKAIEYAMDAWAKGEVREEGYIRENAALRARAQRLEEAGDAMASGNLGLADMRARWAAAKADAAAKGARP